MPVSQSLAERQAQVHRVLANPRRLMILWTLGDGELSVGEIADAIGASLQCTSQHLRLMREHAMVCSRRQGQTIYYRARYPYGPTGLDGFLPLSQGESSSVNPIGPTPTKKEIRHD